MGSSLTTKGKQQQRPLSSSSSVVRPFDGQSPLEDSLLEHSGSVDVICFSDDGSVMATGSDDCTVRIWSTMTSQCQCIGILAGHKSYVTSAAIEDIYVISGSSDSTVRKWDLRSCACVFVCVGHRSGVNRVLCTGKFIFSSSSDSTVRCWDFDSGDLVRVFVGHRSSVTPMIFLPSTARDSDVICGGDDVMTPIRSNGDVVVSGSSDWTCRCWSVDDGRSVVVFRGHSGIVTCLSSDRDGRVLVSGSVDCTVRIWAMGSGEQLRLMDGHSASIICLVVLNDVIFTGSSDATGRAWAINEGLQEVVFKGHSRTILCIQQQNGIVMTGAADGNVICFDANSGNIKRIFKGPPNAVVNRLQVVGRRLFTCSTDGFVRIWNLAGLFEEDLKTQVKFHDDVIVGTRNHGIQQSP